MGTITYGPSKRDSIIDRSITEIRSNVPSIGQYAFYGCTNLTTAEFPKAESIGQYAFYGCTDLSRLELPNVATLGGFCFSQCTNLESISLPNVVGGASGSYSSCLEGCTALTSVNLPSIETLWNYFFRNCTSLVTVVLPSWTRSNTGNFYGCSNLETIDLAGVNPTHTNAIPASEYANCSKLKTLIIRKRGRQSLRNVNAFSGTPFDSGGSGGTIYIPKTWYDHLGDGTSADYKAADVWSDIDGYGTITWAQIEGSQYENYYADGTPIT